MKEVKDRVVIGWRRWRERRGWMECRRWKERV